MYWPCFYKACFTETTTACNYLLQACDLEVRMSFITLLAVSVKKRGAILWTINAGTSNCNRTAAVSAAFRC